MTLGRMLRSFLFTREFRDTGMHQRSLLASSISWYQKLRWSFGYELATVHLHICNETDTVVCCKIFCFRIDINSGSIAYLIRMLICIRKPQIYQYYFVNTNLSLYKDRLSFLIEEMMSAIPSKLPKHLRRMEVIRRQIPLLFIFYVPVA